jgi:3-isopropylmalate/(R)-2-methylmalate dehydratase small subunit
MSFSIALKGRAHLLGDRVDADWDLCDLNALQDMVESGGCPTPDDLARACLTRVDCGLRERIKVGDILVAGKNTGYSAACLDGMSEDPHLYGFAAVALKALGVAAVLCESAATNFQRSSLEHGLPVVECKDIQQSVCEGDDLLVEFDHGTIDNLRTGQRLSFPPLPAFILEMLQAGGLYPLIAAAQRFKV